MVLSSASLNDYADGWQVAGMMSAACIGGGSASVAGCQGVKCVPADNLQACGGLSLLPVRLKGFAGIALRFEFYSAVSGDSILLGDLSVGVSALFRGTLTVEP